MRRKMNETTTNSGDVWRIKLPDIINDNQCPEKQGSRIRQLTGTYLDTTITSPLS